MRENQEEKSMIYVVQLIFDHESPLSEMCVIGLFQLMNIIWCMHVHILNQSVE